MAAMCLPEEAVIGIGRRIKIDDDDDGPCTLREPHSRVGCSALLCILSLTWTKPLRMSEGLRPALAALLSSFWKEREVRDWIREREQGERIVPGAVQRLSPSRPSLTFRTEQQRRLNCRTTVFTSHASAALLSQSRSHRWSRDSRVDV